MTKEELEKENAELDCQKNRNKFCYSCANATEKCFKNEIGCPCDKYKSYKDENVELKKVYDETQKLLDKQIEATYKLDKENQDLRDNYEQFRAVAEPEIERLQKENAKMKYKACCIIEDLKALYFSPVVTKDDLKRQDKILSEAEQFLKETE